MAVDQALLERGYKGDQTMDVSVKVMSLEEPDWSKFDATSSAKPFLSLLKLGIEKATDTNKAACIENPKLIGMCMVAMTVTDDSALAYVLTALYNMLREDSSCYKIFEDAVKSGTDMTPMCDLLKRPRLSKYVADKAAWVLSAVMAHQPRSFDMGKVSDFVKIVEGSDCNELGKVEAITNLLKCASYRVAIFKNHPGVVATIFGKMEPTAPSAILYKSMFALWMLSFSDEIVPELLSGELNVVKKMKDIFLSCRVEKVIRISLTVLKNFLSSKALCEEIVKEGLLEPVASLEYEKWRDPELYDEIQSVVSKINAEVKDLSSFDRYEEELKSGVLSWGYLHTSKFWAENITKFDTDGFRAIKTLAACLEATDPKTLAVACHDIGEFVSLHPAGKKVVAGLPDVKSKVMTFMANDSKDYREVRREALLCCQKIMLNKWQDIAVEGKK
mmetsp:Transcript_74473/g.130186  ORF Transcript_74473/g.130186 Transcript_74473/m.130186 type:complete len:445 (-) Transcript_74473:171-1505(-)